MKNERPPRPATIKDVAARAGVSVGTVSNYLHGRPVRPDRRENIAAAVRALGFIPNPHASAITAARSRVVAVLIERATLASGLWLQTYLLALVAAAGERGLHCRVEHVDGDQPYPAAALFRRVDGIVLIGHFPAAFFGDFAPLAGVPVAAFWDAPEWPRAKVVPYDFKESLARALAMLRAAGHERIGFVCDNRGVGAEKIGEWLRLSAAMLPESRCAWVEAIDGFREGRQAYDATLALRRRCPELTAVVFGADVVAMAGLSALAARRERQQKFLHVSLLKKTLAVKNRARAGHRGPGADAPNSGL